MPVVEIMIVFRNHQTMIANSQSMAVFTISYFGLFIQFDRKREHCLSLPPKHNPSRTCPRPSVDRTSLQWCFSCNILHKTQSQSKKIPWSLFQKHISGLSPRYLTSRYYCACLRNLGIRYWLPVLDNSQQEHN